MKSIPHRPTSTGSKVYSYTGTGSSGVTMEGVPGKGCESPNKLPAATDDHNRMKAHLKGSVNLSTVVNRDIKVNGPLTFKGKDLSSETKPNAGDKSTMPSSGGITADVTVEKDLNKSVVCDQLSVNEIIFSDS